MSRDVFISLMFFLGGLVAVGLGKIWPYLDFAIRGDESDGLVSFWMRLILVTCGAMAVVVGLSLLVTEMFQ